MVARRGSRPCVSARLRSAALISSRRIVAGSALSFASTANGSGEACARNPRSCMYVRIRNGISSAYLAQPAIAVRRPAVRQVRLQHDRTTTPSGTSPVVTRHQRAMSSLRASATIIVLRVFRCAGVRWLCFMLDVSDGACRWRQVCPCPCLPRAQRWLGRGVRARASRP